MGRYEKYEYEWQYADDQAERTAKRKAALEESRRQAFCLAVVALLELPAMIAELDEIEWAERKAQYEADLAYRRQRDAERAAQKAAARAKAAAEKALKEAKERAEAGRERDAKAASDAANLMALLQSGALKRGSKQKKRS